MAEAQIVLLIVTLITTMGLLLQARTEKPTESLTAIIAALRANSAIKDKELIEKDMQVLKLERELRDTKEEMNIYAAYATKLRRALRRFAPTDYVMPEIEEAGQTPVTDGMR